MTNKDIVLSIFNKWNIDMINDDELIRDLYQFESTFDYANIWFRFFKHDTLATDIKNLQRDLKDNNRSHITECIRMALNDPNNFQLNFDTYEHGQ